MKIVYIDSNGKVRDTTTAFFELAGFSQTISCSSFQDATGYLGICDAFVIGDVYDEDKGEIVKVFNEINLDAVVISYSNISSDITSDVSFKGDNHKGLISYLKGLERKKRKAEEVVLLFSGGLDSTTLLYRLLNKNLFPYCLIIDYKQSHRKEVKIAEKICRGLSLPYEIFQVDLSQMGGSRLTGDVNKKFTGSDVVVPGRNTLFITLAAALAKKEGIKKIFLAPNQSDWAVFPDCRPDFYKVMERTIKLGIDKSLEIHTPYLHKTKIQIVAEGLKIKVPYQKTWSCYLGKEKPCGECEACLERKKAFEGNNISDPLLGK